MKYLLLFFVFMLTTDCYADKVILLDENDKHLMSSPYSDAAIEAMKKDAQSRGLDLDKVTAKKITELEWQTIEKQEKI